MCVVTIGAALGWASSADAAPPYVERRLTQPRHAWAFDAGLGIGRYDTGATSGVGPGLNFEGAVGIIERLELGFRQGIRANREGRIAGADHYGRLFDRQTYGTRTDTFANPELRVRGRFVDSEIFELGLEGRVYVPIEQQSRFGHMFGVPMAFHIGRVARLDTGVYIPVVFYDPIATAVSAPLDVWFQVSDRVWLGPMTGVRFYDPGSTRSQTDVSMGFGFGYQILSWLDFKTAFRFPRINDPDGTGNFGIGAGVQLRIE